MMTNNFVFPGYMPNVAETVHAWWEHARHSFALPHPSWRNTGGIKKHSWFGQVVALALKSRVQEVLHD